MRYIWMGFFLLLFTGFTSCATSKAQNQGKPEIPSPGNPVQSAQVVTPQRSPGGPTPIPGKVGGEAATSPAKEQIPVPRPMAQQPPGPGTRPLLPPTPVPIQPGPAVQPLPPPSQPPLPGSSVPGQAMTPAPKPTAATPAGQKFVLNFDNADLYEVIRVMSQMMKVNYIIDPRVKGFVNIHTSGQIGQEELFPIFQTILKLNGATAVQRGNIYEIVPFGDAKKLAVDPQKTRDSGTTLPDEKYSIQIIPLKYIPVTEVTKILKPFLSDGADIVEHPPQNILVIGDIATNIRKSVSIIELFDMDIFANQSVRIYPLRNSDVTEVAKEMERIFSSFEVSVKSGRGVGITFTPITRNNSLLVVSGIPNIFDKVESWLRELDRVPTEGSKLSVYVYYVQNGKAKDMAEVLKQIYSPVKDKKTETRPSTTTTPATRPGQPTPARGAATAKEEGAAAASFMEGELNIVVDETTNALVIRAYQRDYNAIVDTIRKLDLYPKQALIEVFLAEVTLNDDTQLGLEFAFFRNSFNMRGREYSYGISAGGNPPSSLDALSVISPLTGLRYAIESTDRLFAAVRASATDGRVRVLTSPHILASNNKEAKIQIGTSQPILTNTYTTPGAATGTTGVSAGIVEGTIEYKDIGTIVSVTPRISDGGLVTMEINVEDSSVDLTNRLGNLDNIPAFPKKTAKTTLSIMEGQTIVIGGLMGERKEESSTGIPFLSKIPVLGALFGAQGFLKRRTETILLLTPHVISNLDQSNEITREFRERLESMRRDLEGQGKGKGQNPNKPEGKNPPAPPANPPISP